MPVALTLVPALSSKFISPPGAEDCAVYSAKNAKCFLAGAPMWPPPEARPGVLAGGGGNTGTCGRPSHVTLALPEAEPELAVTICVPSESALTVASTMPRSSVSVSAVTTEPMPALVQVTVALDTGKPLASVTVAVRPTFWPATPGAAGAPSETLAALCGGASTVPSG